MRIKINPNYARSEVLRFDYFKKDILKLIKTNGEYKLLDIGCSQLDFSNLPKTMDSFGIDFKDSKYYDKKHFKKCNLDKEKIPFKNEFFDFVVAGEVIEHVKRPFELIEEISRVLKDGGILYLSTPNPHYYLEIIKDVFKINEPDDKEHLNLYSRNHLINYCKSSSLRLVDFKRYKFWIPYLRLMILSLHTPPLFNYQNIYKFRKEK